MPAVRTFASCYSVLLKVLVLSSQFSVIDRFRLTLSRLLSCPLFSPRPSDQQHLNPFLHRRCTAALLISFGSHLRLYITAFIIKTLRQPVPRQHALRLSFSAPILLNYFIICTLRQPIPRLQVLRSWLPASILHNCLHHQYPTPVSSIRHVFAIVATCQHSWLPEPSKHHLPRLYVTTAYDTFAWPLACSRSNELPHTAWASFQ